MTQDEERHHIRQTLARSEVELGTCPQGWIGPEHSESTRTLAPSAKAGVGYLADWCKDAQPYPVVAATDKPCAPPLSWGLSDVNAMSSRQVRASAYGTSLRDAVDVLAEESGRMLAIHLHPWVSGQPFRMGAVEAALSQTRRDARLWMAGPRDMVAWCRGDR